MKKKEDNLIASEEIVITTNNEKIIARLGKIRYKGKEILTYVKGIPESTYRHIWSKAERIALYRGDTLHIEDFRGEEGERFSAYAVWDQDDKKIQLNEYGY